MSEVTVHQAIATALQHQRARELDHAEAIYRQILAAFPDQQDALHLLGSVLYERGKFDEAAAAIRQAIALAPAQTSFRLTLGIVYQGAHRFREAVLVYDELIALAPELSDAHNHRGVALSIIGRHEEAAASFKRALKYTPDNPLIQGNLGIALCHFGQFDEAIWMLRSAVRQLPGNASFHATLGSALFLSGQHEAAIASCQEAIRLAPDRGEAYLTLSTALNTLSRAEEAIGPARRAAELLPDVMDSHGNLAETLRQLGQLDECIRVYQAALRRIPQASKLHNSLGNALKDVGALDEALAAYRKSFEIAPEPSVHSNFLYTLQYHPRMDPGVVFQHHRDFSRRYAEPLAASVAPHTNDPTPGRRLRVGYMSSEFCSHALGHYMVPLLENHDRSAFEIYAYVHTRVEDATTYRLRECTDHWKSIRTLSDDGVAALVRADGIDVFVDLHQHMGGNRILVYARKPAPVQIGFAGYPGTTGLPMIDYRLTDRHMEPPDGFPVPSSETPILLPDTFWCAYPRAAKIPVVPPPALKEGHITFGNFNNFCKVNEPTLALWAKVLQAVPGSRLMMLTSEGAHRKRTMDFLEEQGVAPARITFVPWQKGAAYFELYHRVDIGLDTFPYNGHTTSIDSFFMGVPVVTLVGAEGQTPVARAGWSQLMNLNLGELAGHTREEFVEIAVKLANDVPRLVELRSTMRARVKASPLQDGPRFAKNVEAAYRTAWERWCRKQRVGDEARMTKHE